MEAGGEGGQQRPQEGAQKDSGWSGRAAVRPVLAIDGGGIRGIIPAMVLAELERRTGRAVAELFDLISGTSTGGILAVALTRPGPDGRPAWTAEQLVGLYEQEGPRIFQRGRLGALHGIIDERYDAEVLEEVLGYYCGGSTLSQSLAALLIPAYDMVTRSVFFFDSVRAQNEPEHDYPAAVVARATSAAPTYFQPAVLPGQSGDELVFVDGGLAANNPAMCAFAEAQRREPGGEVLLASLGAGSQTRTLPFEEVRHWGLAQWARPILHVVLDGVSAAIDLQLTALLGRDRYWRFQVELTQARDELDDARPENIALLKREAQRLIDAGAGDLDRLAAALTGTDPGGSFAPPEAMVRLS